jgi:hypothetical protein
MVGQFCDNFSLHQGDNPTDGDNCEDNEEEGERVVPFAGVVWTMRQAAYRGYSALYTVQVFYS